MPGRKKSEWTVQLEVLAAELPKGFDGRAYKECRTDGKWDIAKIAKVCQRRKAKDKADAVLAYLTHRDSKPKAKPRKQGKRQPRQAKMPVSKEQASVNPLSKEQASVNPLSKEIYNRLSAANIGKLIAMLSGMQAKANQSEIARLRADRARIDKRLRKLQGK